MKRAIAMLLIGVICISTAACNKTGGIKETITSTDKQENTENFPSDSTAESNEDQNSQSEMPIRSILSSISEDRLWVEFGGDEVSTQSAALIDVEGNVLCSFDSSEQVVHYTDMHNGVTYFTTSNVSIKDFNELSSRDLHVMDKDANEIKRIKSDNGAGFDILAAEGGKALVYEFGGSTQRLHIVDSKGDFISTRDLDTTCTEWLGSRDNSAYISTIKADDGRYIVNLVEKDGKNLLYLAQLNVPNIVCAETPNANYTSYNYRYGKIIKIYNSNDGEEYQVIPMETYADDAAFVKALSQVEKAEKIYPSGYRNRGVDLYDFKTGKKGTTLKSKDGKFMGYSLTSIFVNDGYAYIELFDSKTEAGYFVVTDLDGKPIYDVKEISGINVLDMDNGNLILRDGVILTTGEKVSYDKLPADFELKNDHVFAYNSAIARQSKDHTYTGANSRFFNSQHKDIHGLFKGGYYIAKGDRPAKEFRTLTGDRTVSTIRFK